jgi:hypothetical protein
MDVPPPKHSLKRKVLGGVLLGLIGVAVLRLVSVPARVPVLVAGLDGDLQSRNDGIDRRMRAKFPAGSAETALVSELAHEGFERGGGRVMRWRSAAAPCLDDVTISWEAAGGRIVSTAASYFHACK